MRQIQAHDPGPPEQPTITGSGQPPSTPAHLSPSPSPDRQLTIVPHPNPLRGTQMGEQPLSQPLPQVAAFVQPPFLTPGPKNTLQQLPVPPRPVSDHNQHSMFTPQSPHQFAPLYTNNTGALNPEDTLDPRDIESIPRPRGLSNMPLRTAMGLDSRPEYYNKIKAVVRGYMSDPDWMDYSNVPDNKKRWLYEKVFNDPRIPIIKRFENNWATDEAAKKTASVRRKHAYSCGDATPPAKYAYNAANSAKRNPAAPRGRWSSISESVECKGKGKKAQHTERPARDASVTSTEHLDQANPNAVNIDATNVHPLARPPPSPSESQDVGPNRISSCEHSSRSSLQPGPSHTGEGLASPPASFALTFGVNDGPSPMYPSSRLLLPTSNGGAITGPAPCTASYQRSYRLSDEPFMSPAVYPTSRILSHPTAGRNTIPGPEFQPIQYQVHQPLSPSRMENLYSFNADDEHSKHSKPPNEDGDDSRAPQN